MSNLFLNFSNKFADDDFDDTLTMDSRRFGSLPRSPLKLAKSSKTNKPASFESKLEESSLSLKEQIDQLQSKLSTESDRAEKLSERLQTQECNYKLIITKLQEKYEARLEKMRDRCAKLFIKSDLWRQKYLESLEANEKNTLQMQEEKLTLLSAIETLKQEMKLKDTTAPPENQLAVEEETVNNNSKDSSNLLFSYRILLDIALSRLAIFEKSIKENVLAKTHMQNGHVLKGNLQQSKSCPNIIIPEQEESNNFNKCSKDEILKSMKIIKTNRAHNSNNLKNKKTADVMHGVKPFTHKTLFKIFPNLRRNHSDKAIEKRRLRSDVSSWHGVHNITKEVRLLNENSNLKNNTLLASNHSQCDNNRITKNAKTLTNQKMNNLNTEINKMHVESKHSFYDKLLTRSKNNKDTKDNHPDGTLDENEILDHSSTSSSTSSSVKRRVSKRFGIMKRHDTPLTLTLSLDNDSPDLKKINASSRSKSETFRSEDYIMIKCHDTEHDNTIDPVNAIIEAKTLSEVKNTNNVASNISMNSTSETSQLGISLNKTDIKTKHLNISQLDDDAAQSNLTTESNKLSKSRSFISELNIEPHAKQPFTTKANENGKEFSSISNFSHLAHRRNGMPQQKVENVFYNKMRKSKSVSMIDKLSANIRSYINKF